jgi:hypothetical protein
MTNSVSHLLFSVPTCSSLETAVQSKGGEQDDESLVNGGESHISMFSNRCVMASTWLVVGIVVICERSIQGESGSGNGAVKIGQFH